jgi:hypothetical protein
MFDTSSIAGPELTESDINLLLAAIPTMALKEKEALLADIEKWQELRTVAQARTDFLAFCHRVYPGFKEGPHHRYLKPLLHGVKDGTHVPPRLF